MERAEFVGQIVGYQWEGLNICSAISFYANGINVLVRPDLPGILACLLSIL